MVTLSASDAKHGFARLMEAASSGEVVGVTRYGEVKFVVVPISEYLDLTGQESLEDLSTEFEELYSSMQQSGWAEAVEGALSASPEELGRVAAVAASRKRAPGPAVQG